jgi:hypothetical protein
MDAATLNLAGNKNSFTVTENNPVTIRVVANFDENAVVEDYQLRLHVQSAKTTNGNGTITVNQNRD